MSVRFKHRHSQSTQLLVDAIISIGPEKYIDRTLQVIRQFDIESPGGLFARDIFRFGAAELYEKAKEKLEIVAELEDGN